MARPRLDVPKAAAIVIDSMFFSDAKVAQTHGVSVGSVKRYRTRAQTDSALAAEVQRLKSGRLQPARLTIEEAIANALTWLDETMGDLPRTVDGFSAVGQHVRSLHEMELESNVIEARIDGLDRARVSR